MAAAPAGPIGLPPRSPTTPQAFLDVGSLVQLRPRSPVLSTGSLGLPPARSPALSNGSFGLPPARSPALSGGSSYGLPPPRSPINSGGSGVGYARSPVYSGGSSVSALSGGAVVGAVNTTAGSASSFGGSTGLAPAIGPLTVAVDLDEVLAPFVTPLAHYHNATFGTALGEADFVSYTFMNVWGGTPQEAARKVSEFYSGPFFDGAAAGAGGDDAAAGSGASSSSSSSTAAAAVVAESHPHHAPAGGLAPLPGAQDALRALKATGAFRFVLVTGRQHVREAHTRAWIGRHYAGVFDDLMFGNHYAGSGVVRTKSDMCAEIGAVALIDDNLGYATECAASLPLVLLFGSYPWNQTAGLAAACAASAVAVGGEHTPLAADAGAPVLPPNVVRVTNWSHVSAVLLRLRHRREAFVAAGYVTATARGSGAVPAAMPPPLPAGASRGVVSVPGLLGMHELYTVTNRDSSGGGSSSSSSSGVPGSGGSAPSTGSSGRRPSGGGAGVPPPPAPPPGTLQATSPHTLAETLRRVLELQPAVTLTAVGFDTRTVVEVATVMAATDDCTMSRIATALEGAAGSGGHVPRLTVTLARTARFLERRFGVPVGCAPLVPPSPTSAAAAAAATTPGAGFGADRVEITPAGAQLMVGTVLGGGGGVGGGTLLYQSPPESVTGPAP